MGEYRELDVRGRTVRAAHGELELGEGWRPTDLAMAAVALCSASTLRTLAAARGWPVDDVAVRVSSLSEEDPKRIVRFQVVLEVGEALLPAQLDELAAEVDARCKLVGTLRDGAPVDVVVRQTSAVGTPAAGRAVPGTGATIQCDC